MSTKKFVLLLGTHYHLYSNCALPKRLTTTERRIWTVVGRSMVAAVGYSAIVRNVEPTTRTTHWRRAVRRSSSGNRGDLSSIDESWLRLWESPSRTFESDIISATWRLRCIDWRHLKAGRVSDIDSLEETVDSWFDVLRHIVQCMDHSGSVWRRSTTTDDGCIDKKRLGKWLCALLCVFLLS